jgi:hypothetical protein
VEKDSEVMEVCRGSSTDTSGVPTPRAKEYMTGGEWDEKDKVSIKFIIDENCRGQIGVTSAGPRGADRFCGKVQCVTATHRKSQVKVPSNHWFIQAGPRSAAVLLSFPRLPSMELGGPVPKLFEAHVSDVCRKQCSGLTMGKWCFLFVVSTPRAVLFRRLTIRLDWIPLRVKVFQSCHCYLSVRLWTTRLLRLNR